MFIDFKNPIQSTELKLENLTTYSMQNVILVINISSDSVS